jgi:hypothetical protein
MQYRILELGNQYKVAAAYGMRYALHFDRYTDPVNRLEERLIPQLGYPATALAIQRDRPQIHHSSAHYRWYSGWKNLRAATRTEWLMVFTTDKDRTLALLQIDQ